jgi:large subunit ribosomal protein LP1
MSKLRLTIHLFFFFFFFFFFFIFKDFKIQGIVSAAGVEVEPIWFSLYAKALAGQDLKALLLNVGAPGAGPAVAAGGAAAAGGDAAPAEEAKEEEKEESDDDMGFGKYFCFG